METYYERKVTREGIIKELAVKHKLSQKVVRKIAFSQFWYVQNVATHFTPDKALPCYRYQTTGTVYEERPREYEVTLPYLGKFRLVPFRVLYRYYKQLHGCSRKVDLKAWCKQHYGIRKVRDILTAIEDAA